MSRVLTRNGSLGGSGAARRQRSPVNRNKSIDGRPYSYLPWKRNVVDNDASDQNARPRTFYCARGPNRRNRRIRSSADAGNSSYLRNLPTYPSLSKSFKSTQSDF